MTLHVGIDLGGTKIELLVLSDGGAEVFRARRPTEQERGYAAIVERIRDMVGEAERAVGPAITVGIGTPGSVSPESGLLRNSNTVCLNDRPLASDLARALGKEVRLANDADCFALSEATDGAGAGAPTVFGVILGTGTGAGVVVRGALLGGPNAIAGEWGHNPLPSPRDDERPGPACHCGRRGCVETWISGPALSRDHEERTGQPRSAEEIGAAARGGDTFAIATLERHADRVARSLALVVNVLDPHVVVLGGGVGQTPGLVERVSAALPAYVFSDCVRTRLVLPRFGDASGVRGAAWLGRGAPASEA